MDENRNYLIQKYKIVYLNSIRNIGEKEKLKLDSITDSKVIGNPLFSCTRIQHEDGNGMLFPFSL